MPLDYLPPPTRAYLKLGILNQENVLAGLHALSLAAFTRPVEENGLGWSPLELEVLLARVRSDIKNTAIHAYWPM